MQILERLERIESYLKTIADHIAVKEEKKRSVIRNKSYKANIDEIYKNYPRKVGKTQGYKKLEADLKDENTFKLCVLALEMFNQSIAANKTEEKFIPHFSTWANRWRDYLPDEDTPQLQLKQIDTRTEDLLFL